MGSNIGHELSLLGANPTSYVPKRMSEFLGEVSMMGNVSERLMKIDDFVKRLEDEMKKIDAFKRELPLSFLLLNDAIVALKGERMTCCKSNVEPVLEEFIPLKKICDEDEKCEDRKENDIRDKQNWLSSVQLWNSDHHQIQIPNTDSNHNQTQNLVKKGAEEEVHPTKANHLYESHENRIEGKREFMSFNEYSCFPVRMTKEEGKEEPPVVGLSLVIPSINHPKEEFGSIGLKSKTIKIKESSSFAPSVQSNLRTSPPPTQQQNNSRKQRRCWSPELHRRFVNALQQLGGSQVATPKQIRELLQVDGLTNDEVKSHLQKYRLHTRRLPAANHPLNPPHAVALGGLWLPQEQCFESSKLTNSYSGSPHGPLQLNGNSRGTSTTGGEDSMEDYEDEKSVIHSWKSHIHTSGNEVV